jgi:hypothetical protein
MIWWEPNINLEMVGEGYAEAYRKYLKEPYSSQFIDAEGKARTDERYLEVSSYESPSVFRKHMRCRKLTNVVY